MSAKPDYIKIAARFRRYAALCREQAESSPFPMYQPVLLGMADRWERDAERVLIDA